MRYPDLSSRVVRVAVAVALLAGASVGAQMVHPTPAPIISVDWGTIADTVIARAGASGWTFVKIDDDGDYAFQGRIGQAPAMAFATFSITGGLTRLLVSVAPHPSAPVTYRELTDTLINYHGRARLADNDESSLARPAPTMAAAAAWPGILTGLRRDGWIMVIFTCPEASPKLPPARTERIA
jgi:hypothetical protein